MCCPITCESFSFALKRKDFIFYDKSRNYEKKSLKVINIKCPTNMTHSFLSSFPSSHDTQHAHNSNVLFTKHHSFFPYFWWCSCLKERTSFTICKVAFVHTSKIIMICWKIFKTLSNYMLSACNTKHKWLTYRPREHVWPILPSSKCLFNLRDIVVLYQLIPANPWLTHPPGTHQA